jgi:hypothetical protein
VNFTYDLPVARSATGWTKTAFANWQLAGINNLRSGSPLTVFVSGNRSRSGWAPSLGPGLGQDRASIAPGYTHQSAVLGGPDQYFDPRAFVLSAPGTLGNLGRGTFIGPGLRGFDLAALKSFRLGGWNENARIQFRAESFNLFNHANFAPPSLLAISTTTGPLGGFGRIRSTVTSSRQIQFALRLQF